jgi:hypothetical protein
MTARATVMPVRILNVAVIATLSLALGVIGFWMLFSYFAGYDDEGYILISARENWQHGGLYTSVYSQYGPAFYVLTDLVQLVLGTSLNHTVGRLLTLGLWLGTALICGALVWRQSRSTSLTAFTLAATFLYLHFTPDEAFHPGTLLIFLLAGSMDIFSRRAGSDSWQRAALMAGAIGAFLTLIKINVGVFYLLALGSWGLLYASADWLRRAAVFAVPPLLLLAGAALMQSRWDEGWVGIYLAVFGVGAITIVATIRGEALLRAGDLGWLVAAGSAVTLAVLGVTLLRGTTPLGLLEGILLEPLRHSSSYSYPVDWRPGTVFAAMSSLALVAAVRWLARHHSPARADTLIVCFRLGQLVALLVAFGLLMEARVIGAVFSYIVPFLWAWVIPLQRIQQTPASNRLRGLLALMVLLQFLQAFPIGGIQEVWGTFLFIPLIGLGLHDVRRWLSAGEWGAFWQRPLIGRIGGVALLGVVAAKTTATALEGHHNYSERAALALPGAELLHLPEAQRTAYRILALNAVVHADMLYSLPGMFSFNLWTGLPTPTRKNTTVWFTLLNTEEQKQIMAALEAAENPCIIVEERLVDLTQQINVPIQGVLRDYLFSHFVPVFRLDGFAFMIRKGRAISPLGIAALNPLSEPDENGHDTELAFQIVSNGPIGSIEARDLDAPPNPDLAGRSLKGSVSATAIDRSGRARAPTTVSNFPVQLAGLTAVSLRFKQSVNPAANPVFYVRSPDGVIIAEVRTSN